MQIEEHIPRLAALFCLSGLFVTAVEPLVIRWAWRFGVLDTPDWRRVHQGRVARAGGLVFFPALAVGLAAVLVFWPVYWRPQYAGLLAALLVISLAGVRDDLNGMKPLHKLGVQLLAGVILFVSGYRVGDLGLPFTELVVDIAVLDFFVTVIGVAAIINAVNMLDGLDGLAAGCCFIMAVFLLINKAALSSLNDAAILVIVAGAALGFLRHNFHPARVFMGDTGSMFLGLVLAAETLDSASQGAALTTILLPLVVLGIPIFDMLRTVVTRLSVSRNVFAADKSHLHHRLLELGLSHREAVLFIYGLHVYMGVMAVLYQHIAVAYRGLFLSALGLFLLMASFLVGKGHRPVNQHGAGDSP
jgi:UDP-GlcNAc:undecaprenyl-phosphate/decaprenyl-phosphate GlcNAc-1-phosphate transferase